MNDLDDDDLMINNNNNNNESKVTILQNQQVQTDRTIPNNKPDIIICDNEKSNVSVNRHCNLRDRYVIKK
jgi:hypothetical protein